MNHENAVAITMTTLVGCDTSKFPVNHGNCFSVETESKKGYRIVNFYVENLEEGLKRKKIEWPIRILPISENTALIDDTRIPSNWYNEHYCSCCCPENLLPEPQRKEKERSRERGECKSFDVDGIRYENWDLSKAPSWKTKKEQLKNTLHGEWKIEIEKDIECLTSFNVTEEIEGED